MEKEKKYSPWEYEEEHEEEEQPELNEDGTPKDPNAEEEDDSKNKSSVSDDTPVEIEVDGKKETITLGELKGGYMRQSDYTRKSQEVAEMKKNLNNASPEEKKEIIDKSKEIIQNPGNFTADDIKTARTLLEIVKGTGLAKEFGLMTREEFESDKAKEKQVAEFGSKLDTAKAEVGKMTISYQENGKTVKFSMPAWDEDSVLSYMQETGIHDPLAAYLRMNDAKYREFIIKQAKGDTSYKSDKGGKKVEPKDNPVDVRSEEGMRSFLADEIHKLNK